MFDDWEDQEQPRGALRHRHRRRRRRGLAIFLTLLFILLAGAASALTYYKWCQGASGEQQKVTLLIPPGTSGGEVVSLLHENGVIRCGLVSKVIVRNRDQTFEAGTYNLSTRMTLDDALDALARGPIAPPTIRLTIPEGWRLTQIAGRVEELLHIPRDAFLDLANSGSYSSPPYLPAGTDTLEGFLFPNTYRLPKQGVTPGDVIVKLLAEFGNQVRDLPWQNAKRLGVSDYELVTIASMIEREARVARDRPNIAAVIYNRLKIGMPLGIDATLQYVDPDPSDGLTDSDLEIDSPYNTRLRTGLPPTPIASPGLASLEAALHPADVDFLYYVLCGADGHHEFTNSYDQFLQLKAGCLG